MVTLSYDYTGRNVWLDDLAPQDDPANHDLCERHAERVTRPTGLGPARPAQRGAALAGPGQLNGLRRFSAPAEPPDCSAPARTPCG